MHLKTVVSWTKWFELHGSTYMQIFSNEYSWPFTSTGFASSNSTNHRWKTVSSHSRAQIPNCRTKTLFSIHSWLNTKCEGSTAESSHTQIFALARVSVPSPALFKGQLHFKSTQVLDILNHLFSIFFHWIRPLLPSHLPLLSSSHLYFQWGSALTL